MSKTVRVRIAVAIDAAGQWTCAGCSVPDQPNNLVTQEESDEDDRETAMERFADHADGDAVIVWVEADVPLPSSVTVKGEVKS